MVESLRAELAGRPGVRYEFGRPSYSASASRSSSRSIRRTARCWSRAPAGRAAVAEAPGLADVRSTAEARQPGDPGPVRRRPAGQPRADRGPGVRRAALEAAGGGRHPRLDEGDRRIDIVVRGGERLRSRAAAVPELIVHAEDARPVPLRALGSAEVSKGPAELRRVGQRPAVVISAGLDGVDLAGATEEIDARVAGLGLAPASRPASGASARRWSAPSPASPSPSASPSSSCTS